MDFGDNDRNDKSSLEDTTNESIDKSLMEIAQSRHKCLAKPGNEDFFVTKGKEEEKEKIILSSRKIGRAHV